MCITSLGWKPWRSRIVNTRLDNRPVLDRCITTCSKKQVTTDINDRAPRRKHTKGLVPFKSRQHVVSTDPQAALQLAFMPSYSSSLGADVDNSLLKGRFMIPAAEVQAILAEQNMNMEQLLFSLIQPASRMAWPPISGFYVGAVGLGSSGAIYVGVNIEFPGVTLNNSIHAEQFLLVNCLHHGEAELKALAVSAAPCGHCRQFYCEVVNADTIQFMFGKDPKPQSLDQLLPQRFGPSDLIHDKPFPLLFQRQDNRVAYRKSSVAQMLTRAGDFTFQEAAKAALKAANQSYSPYAQCPAGAAIITHSGKVFSGSSMESAAYNPGLSPFHTAFINAVAKKLKGYHEIKEVVLAEVWGAQVKHRGNVKNILKHIAPAGKVTTLYLHHERPAKNALPGQASLVAAA